MTFPTFLCWGPACGRGLSGRASGSGWPKMSEAKVGSGGRAELVQITPDTGQVGETVPSDW